MNHINKLPATGRNVFFLICLLMTVHFTAFADAFPRSPQALGGPVLSAELLGSLEIGGKTSALLWGGVAAVSSPLYLFKTYGGPEAAIEFRRYFSVKEDRSWAFSVYAGAAYNLIGEHYSAFTPGVKLTRKRSRSQVFQTEPYISLSYPYYIEEKMTPFLPFVTFGYRIVFEKRIK